MVSNPIFLPFFIFHILKFRKKVDIVYCVWSPTIMIGWILKLFCKVKVIAVLQGTDVRSMPHFLLKFFLNRTDIITTGFEELYRIIKNLNIKPTIVLVRNFIDEKKFILQKKTPKTILFPARLYPGKNPLFFLKVAKETKKQEPNIKFIMVGDGELKKKVLHIIQKDELTNLNYLGASSNVINIMAKTEAVFFASTVNIWSTTLIEAILSRCVCILNNTKETKEFFNKNNCILYENNNAKDCSRKIIKLLTTKYYNTAYITKEALKTIKNEKFLLKEIIKIHKKYLKKIFNEK